MHRIKCFSAHIKAKSHLASVVISPGQGVFPPMLVKGSLGLAVQWFRVVVLVNSLLKNYRYLGNLQFRSSQVDNQTMQPKNLRFKT